MIIQCIVYDSVIENAMQCFAIIVQLIIIDHVFASEYEYYGETAKNEQEKKIILEATYNDIR